MDELNKLAERCDHFWGRTKRCQNCGLTREQINAALRAQAQRREG